MCGRFALYANENEIVSHFSLNRGFVMRERYNIAPSEMIPVVVAPNKIEFARWGFLPRWLPVSAQTPAGHINARIESIVEKPFFKESFLKQRCLIPISGFYEWKSFSNKKQPFYCTFEKTSLFALGGILSTWQKSPGETLLTCAILTQAARGKNLKIHARMPYIVPIDAYATWLAQKPLAEKLPEVTEAFLEKMRIYAVSQQMNHPSFDNISCIESL